LYGFADWDYAYLYLDGYPYPRIVIRSPWCVSGLHFAVMRALMIAEGKTKSYLTRMVLQ
jgi:hypothetical protein